jgi:hypothetical protein
MLPDRDVARIRRWADQRVPGRVRDELRIELDLGDRSVTIFECRPPLEPEEMGSEWTRFPVARLLYTKSRNEWTLYWRDRNLEFHRYDRVAPTPDVGDLIEEVDRDPTCIFWASHLDHPGLRTSMKTSRPVCSRLSVNNHWATGHADLDVIGGVGDVSLTSISCSSGMRVVHTDRRAMVMPDTAPSVLPVVAYQ